MATNIGAVLKAEIARVARKEIRTSTEGLQKNSAAHRADIAALKRRLAALEHFVKHMAKALKAEEFLAPVEVKENMGPQYRFSPRRFANLRNKIGFSARQMGRLMDVSQDVIYAWEKGKVKPNAEQLLRIVATRGIDREAALEAIGEAAPAAGAKKSTPAA